MLRGRCPIIPLYLTGILDVKRYALVMAQRAGPGIARAGGSARGVRGGGAPPGESVGPPGNTADSEAEILDGPVLRDEVDDLVAAWRAQRPDLDVEPMQVLSRISRLARHLDIARRGAFTDHGLESWEFDVLSALRRQGPPFQLTPGALLRATLVTSGTMTNRVDRLAAAGLVRREPDPRDKRGVLVTLTDQGREQVDAAMADLLRREQALLAGLDNVERRHLADLMRILLAPFDAGLSGLRSLCYPARLRAPFKAPPSLVAPSSRLGWVGGKTESRRCRRPLARGGLSSRAPRVA
jgi:DNA-binding MarR family transcriptional regulator